MKNVSDLDAGPYWGASNLPNTHGSQEVFTVPLKSGKSKKVVSENISEFHKGETFAKTKKKFGAKKANAQAVAVALDKRRKSK